MEHMWWADPAVLHALVAQLNDARTRAADSSEAAEEALGDSAVPSGPDGTASTPTLTTTNGVVAAGMRPWDGARSQQQPSGAHRRESDVFTEDFGLIDHAE
jgi:hypothetical protein